MALDGRPVYEVELGSDVYAAQPVYVVDPAVVGVYGGMPVSVIDPDVLGYYAGQPVYVTDDPELGLWVYTVEGSLGSAVGALALLSGETDGFASDFTYADDSKRVAKIVSSVQTEYATDVFYSNGGTSPQLVYDSTGTLVWKPHNMLLRAEDFTNASWGKTDATITADQITDPSGALVADLITEGSGGAASVRQGVSGLILGAAYCASVRVKRGNHDWFSVGITNAGSQWAYSRFNLITQEVSDGSLAGGATRLSSGIIDEGNGWLTCYVSASFTAGTTIDIDTSSATSAGSGTRIAGATRYMSRGQINRGTVPTAYLATTTAARYGLAIDHDPVTLASRGVLVESAATNLALRCSEFNNATWSGGASQSVSADVAAAPNGRTEADRLVDDGATGTDAGGIRLFQSVTVTAVAHTLSVFIKRDQAPFAFLRTQSFAASSNGISYFNLSTGFAATKDANHSASAVLNVGGGWYRLSVTFTGDAGGLAGLITVGLCDADGSVTATRNGAKSAWLWGAQLETGSVASSPIPTFAATVTRAADAPNFLLSAIPFSATAGTVIWEGTPLSAANSDYFSIDDGTTTERFYSFTSSSASVFSIGDSTAQIGSLAPGSNAAVAANTRFKVGYAWAVNDVAFVKDGGTAGTDTSATLPTVTTFRVGCNVLNGSQFNGHIRKVTYLPRRMTNADLQVRTTA